MRIPLGLLAIATMGLLAAACGGDDDAAGANATLASAVTVNLNNWAVEPSTRTLAAGKVSVTALHEMDHGGGHGAAEEGGATHQLVIAALEPGAKAGQNKYGKPVLNIDGLKPGESKTEDVDLAPGVYEFACLVVEDVSGGKSVNHYDKGMYTTVTVK